MFSGGKGFPGGLGVRGLFFAGGIFYGGIFRGDKYLKPFIIDNQLGFCDLPKNCY